MVSERRMDLVDLRPEQLPAVLATWWAHRARNQSPADGDSWAVPVAAREGSVAAALGQALGRDPGRGYARAVLRDGAVAAYLIGREARLPRSTPYRAYMPDHFLASGADEWAVADAGERELLADLYADLTRWGLARGIGDHQLGLPAGDDCADLWRDLGFARHDCYAFLPLGAARPAPDGVAVRRAGPGDLAIAAGFALAEAEHHQTPPICAFAPPGLAAAKRRDMAESLGDPEAFVLLAEVAGRPAGGLSASFLRERPFWAPSAMPAPCAFIESAFVAPEARGRGVLRALIAALAGAVGERAGRGLFVTFLPANRGAALAWRGLGFRPLLTIHLRRLDPRAVRQQRGQRGASSQA